MSQQLINHSNDLKQLRDEGYSIEVFNGYLIIHEIPYVNNAIEIKKGKLILQLATNGNNTLVPNTHIAHFMGEFPCHVNGSYIEKLRHANQNIPLRENIIMNFSFSNKPSNGYSNYYQQAVTYINIISAPSFSIDKEVKPNEFKVVENSTSNNSLNYFDTNASRANIIEINNKLIGQKVGIIGLGGTGSYILDLLAKTFVEEIHLFDGDIFLQHNAFRAPTAPTIEELNQKMFKVDYFSKYYSNMHNKIIPHSNFITNENIGLLKECTFVFLCIDKGEIRKIASEYFMKNHIPFIDTGIGLSVVDSSLLGMVRVTAVTPGKNDHVKTRIPMADLNTDEYKQNIQIAELNALNAVLAVIKFKKILGFYQDLENEYNNTYSINVSQLSNDEINT